MKVKIGFIGMGTVGQGVVLFLEKNGSLIKSRSGVEFEIVKVAVRDMGLKRDIDLDKGLFTEDPFAVTDHPDVDIVIELMGGTTLAYDIAMKTLSSGKTLVTANKALIAEKGPALFEVAEKNNASVFYEASVAGGIPILKALNEGLTGNDIISIQGILNGTCNFILSQMETYGTPFQDVVKLAQDKGYAEADPTLDVGGFDAAHKTAILASLAYGRWFDGDSVTVKGIENVQLMDMEYARDAGFRIKLIGRIVKNADGRVSLSVQPTLVPLDSILANVSLAFNGIRVVGDVVGDTMFYGQGAGREATASAVLADLVDAAQGLKNTSEAAHPGFVKFEGCTGLLPAEEQEERAYIRLAVGNDSNVLATVTGVFGKHGISISSVNSKDISRDAEFTNVVILTHAAPVKKIQAALAEVNELPETSGDPVHYCLDNLKN